MGGGGEYCDHCRRVMSHYDERAATYDEEHEHPYRSVLYDKITWRHTEPYLPKSGVVLDAGGRTGKWATRMATRQLSVVILDISKGMLRRVLEKIRALDLHSLVDVV